MGEKVERYFHRPDKPLSLGCVNCPQLRYCGGLHADQGFYGCESFCRQCESAEACDMVCKKYPAKYFAHHKEIDGFDLHTLPRTQAQPFPELPTVVPQIFHPYSRRDVLKSPAVAVKLCDLYSHKTGKLKFSSRAELAHHLRFEASAKLIVLGVDDDPPIENFWSVARAAGIIQQLSLISPDLVTTPNYSLPANVPRLDNIHAVKRIGKCFVELRQAGLPASLHLNARADRDFERWIEFTALRNEVVSVTVECDTGARKKERGEWLFKKLQLLAKSVPRPLHLVMKGGDWFLPELSAKFASVSFIDSTSFMKTVFRFKLDDRRARKRSWVKIQTAHQEPLDELLQFNVDHSAALLQSSLRLSKKYAA